MRLGKKKPKARGGAPRTGRWTRDVPERTRLGGEHRGSLILLLIAGGLIVVAMGIFALTANARLDHGLNLPAVESPVNAARGARRWPERAA